MASRFEQEDFYFDGPRRAYSTNPDDKAGVIRWDNRLPTRLVDPASLAHRPACVAVVVAVYGFGAATVGQLIRFTGLSVNNVLAAVKDLRDAQILDNAVSDKHLKVSSPYILAIKEQGGKRNSPLHKFFQALDGSIGAGPLTQMSYKLRSPRNNVLTDVMALEVVLRMASHPSGLISAITPPHMTTDKELLKETGAANYVQQMMNHNSSAYTRPDGVVRVGDKNVIIEVERKDTTVSDLNKKVGQWPYLQVLNNRISVMPVLFVSADRSHPKTAYRHLEEAVERVVNPEDPILGGKYKSGEILSQRQSNTMSRGQIASRLARAEGLMVATVKYEEWFDSAHSKTPVFDHGMRVDVGGVEMTLESWIRQLESLHGADPHLDAEMPVVPPANRGRGRPTAADLKARYVLPVKGLNLATAASDLSTAQTAPAPIEQPAIAVVAETVSSGEGSDACMLNPLIHHNKSDHLTPKQASEVIDALLPDHEPEGESRFFLSDDEFDAKRMLQYHLDQKTDVNSIAWPAGQTWTHDAHRRYLAEYARRYTPPADPSGAVSWARAIFANGKPTNPSRVDFPDNNTGKKLKAVYEQQYNLLHGVAA